VELELDRADASEHLVAVEQFPYVAFARLDVEAALDRDGSAQGDLGARELGREEPTHEAALRDPSKPRKRASMSVSMALP
jgi:hypothetical protein